MILSEPLAVTQLVTAVLEHLQIPYVVGGSLASSLHGIPRATQDVDLLADIHLHQVTSLVASLQDAFYIDADSVREAIKQGASFNVIHLTTMFKVDIFVLSPDDFCSQQENWYNSCVVELVVLRMLSMAGIASVLNLVITLRIPSTQRSLDRRTVPERCVGRTYPL